MRDESVTEVGGCQSHRCRRRKVPQLEERRIGVHLPNVVASSFSRVQVLCLKQDLLGGGPLGPT